MGNDLWQKCPVCNGTGTVNLYPQIGGSWSDVCPHCGGQHVVSILNGQPPNNPVNATTSSGTDQPIVITPIINH